MSKGDRNLAPGKMSEAEIQCWSSGGVWMGGYCVQFAKTTLSRGLGCDPGPTERLIQASLPGPLRQARAKVIKEIITITE